MTARAKRVSIHLPGTAPGAPRRNTLVVLGYLLGLVVFVGVLFALF
ncbi:hypothetical protein [Halobellus rarus]|uniref:Uncharacterized protein n=1 Tax=Halobellus rarus TaxID=1126237 RepID=A0ABD6CKK4_9EURY|nr:hypothetical protein [Halobellus rarus]